MPLAGAKIRRHAPQVPDRLERPRLTRGTHHGHGGFGSVPGPPVALPSRLWRVARPPGKLVARFDTFAPTPRGRNPTVSPGDTAPDLTLLQADGTPAPLSALLDREFLLLVFLRHLA